MSHGRDVSIHPSAIVESASIGAGTVIWAFAHVMEGASVGQQCKIGDHAFLESGSTIGDRVTVKNGCMIWHGVHVGDDAFIGPNVVFTNDLRPRAHLDSNPDEWVSTHVGVGVSIGASSTILCGVELGRSAMVGAGSVVTKDVPAHALVVGNPARQIGWVCDCGESSGHAGVCQRCLDLRNGSALTEHTGV